MRTIVRSFLALALCGSAALAAPAPVDPGDVVLGLSTPNAATTLDQIRAGAKVGSFTSQPFAQSMEFDNAGGFPQNARGNLLGLNFGSSAGSGGTLYNFATNGTDVGQSVFTFGGTFITATRVGGLSVSPNNQFLALIGTDSGRGIVLGYNAGASVGTGSGASVTGGAETAVLFKTGSTQGSCWLDNDTVIFYGIAPSGSGVLYTADVGPGPTLSNVTQRLTTTVPETGTFTSACYQPTLSPYVYCMFAAFLGSDTVSYLNVIDPATWTLKKQVFFECFSNGSGGNDCFLQTGREINIGPDRGLYISQYAGSQAQQPKQYIDVLDLDLNNDNIIDAADTMGLMDNASAPYYGVSSGVDSSFNGLAVALTTSAQGATGACCRPLPLGGCVVVSQADCMTIGGTYNGNGVVCASVQCSIPQGACCLPSGGCMLLTQADCIAQNGAYRGDGLTCQAAPCPAAGACCLADGSCISTTARNCYTQGGFYKGDGVACGSAQCAAVPASVLCYDFDSSPAGVTFSATPDNAANNGAFPEATDDVFGVTDRTVDFDFADDTAGSFSGDTFGVLRTAKTDKFFGVEDLVIMPGESGLPEDEPVPAYRTGTGTATWTFNIAGLNNVSLDIDFAAMGDFESGNDSYAFTASIDGGTPVPVFAVTIDESLTPTYFMESGTAVELQDPVTVSGITVLNNFVRINSGLLGSGNTLTLTFNATSDGGKEVFLFDNICVRAGGAAVQTGACCFANGSCSVLTAANCAGQGGTYAGNNVTCAAANCQPTPTTGACCTGTTCQVLTQANCTTLGGSFKGPGTACNASTCCPADFNGVNGVTVQDIFDFLTAWLAGNSSADFNHVNGVTVQDIFDFLTAWLAGC